MYIDCYIFRIKIQGFYNGFFVFYRVINYDEKDFFFCNVCGFCKYVKFDFILIVKFCCVVDFIENEEDRKKVIYNNF